LPEGRIFGQITQTGPKKYFWPGKIGGRKMADFVQKWQKRGQKIFHVNLQGKVSLACSFFHYFLIIKESKYVNQEQFIPTILNYILF
jgi:hypothetical protein